MNNEIINVYRATKIEIAEPENRSSYHAKLAETWGEGNREWEKGYCICCGKPIPNVWECESTNLFTTVCDDCEPLVDAHYNPAIQDSATGMAPKYEKWCPPLMQEWIADKSHPVFNTKEAKEILFWRPGQMHGKQGLIMRGSSGSGKTTMMWALSRELEIAGIIPVILPATKLATRLATAAKAMQDDSLTHNCRCLMIDDLGKEKITETFASGLWALLEHRYLHRKSTIFTTRLKGDELIAQFAVDKRDHSSSVLATVAAQDIVGRIRDMCYPVVLNT